MEVPGFTYTPKVINTEDEKHLIRHLKTEEWNTALSRRTLHYGWEYPYNSFGELKPTDPIPEFLIPLKDKVELLTNSKFDQVIVNEYLPGQGIAPHIDHTNFFGDTIGVISLGSHTCLTLKHRTKKGVDIILEPRSMYVMTDVARYVYRHSIPKRNTDNGRKRGTRYSITFRQVIPRT